MGFQTSHNTKKSKDDSNNTHEQQQSLIPKALNLTHHTLTTNNTKFIHFGYDSWLVKHPSALSLFDRLMKDVNGKRIVVFLDYDGTLSPIVNDPERAFMSDEVIIVFYHFYIIYHIH